MENKIWICPLTKNSGCGEFHMINTNDGGLKHITAYMIQALEKQGWRQVVFPKRSYYYEFDQSHPSYKERAQIGIEDNIELLEVEVV